MSNLNPSLNIHEKHIWIFEKSFLLKNHQYALPVASEIFTSEKFVLENLQSIKSVLNNIKSKLKGYDIKEWNHHTYIRNPSFLVINLVRRSLNVEYPTQAFCKMFEILNEYNLIPKSMTSLNSLHLCEGPGAFVTSLNHYLRINNPEIEWNWCGTTLNPFYEGNIATNIIKDDRFIKNTLNRWDFGFDYSGDIFNELTERHLEKRCHREEIQLITADGSISCFNDPSTQEEQVEDLILTEALIALRILAVGGHFILKMFTFFEESSVNLIYLLINLFGRVHVYKPVTSKEGNSEVYLICVNYRGREFLPDIKPIKGKAMFPLASLPKEFLVDLEDCSGFFAEHQINAIENNILSFSINNHYYNCSKNLKSLILGEYRRRTQLKSIKDYDFIVKRDKYDDSEEHEVVINGENINFIQSNSVDQQLFEETYQLFIKTQLSETRNSIVLKKIDSSCIIYPLKGRSIDKVTHSKFISSNILLFWLKVIQHYSHPSNSTKIVNDSNLIQITQNPLKMKFDLRCLTDIKNFNSFEKKTFLDFCKYLQSDNSERVVIIDFPLITQLSVSFVYYLKNFLFNEVTLVTSNNEEYDNFIELKDRTITDEFQSKLTELIEILEENYKDEEYLVLLGFIKLENLLEKSFLNHIKQFNNSICLKYSSILINNKK